MSHQGDFSFKSESPNPAQHVMLYRQMLVSSSSQVSNWVVLGRDKEFPPLLHPMKGTVPTRLTQGSGDAHMLLEVL